MTLKEKFFNLLLKPFGLSVITKEDWEKGLKAYQAEQEEKKVHS